MDPFTATSLAETIVQFVQFARSIYQQVREIQKSASSLTKKNEDMQWSAEELQQIFTHTAIGVGEVGPLASPHERAICELGQKCQELSTVVVHDVRAVARKGRSNVFDAAKGVLRRIRNMTEINTKIDKLDRVQAALFKHLHAHINDQQRGVTNAVVDLVEQNRELETSRTTGLEQFKTEIRSAISTITARPKIHTDDGFSSVLSDWGRRANQYKKEQPILGSLHFPEMLRRKDDILNRHSRTFIHTDEDINKSLEEWARPKELIKASFYFWYTGSPLQKLQDGLLRSLLFEILRQCPSSIPTVCQGRWNDSETFTSSPWDTHELRDTLKHLNLHSTMMRFCFFIDGLDEYGGPREAGENDDASPAQVMEIIETMQTLSKLKDIRLCISSRPWVVFENPFGRNTDRKLYVFVESRVDEADLQRLVSGIVENSHGVFLWVVPVVESLLRGLMNHDRPADLRQRLLHMPTTLTGYFERMLSSAEDIDQEQATQILQTSLCADWSLYVITYSFIGDEQLTQDECIWRQENAEIRLKVRCPDFLRVIYDGGPPKTAQDMAQHEVHFLHRTKLLRQRIKSPFDPYRYTFLSLLAQIKGAYLSPEEGTRNQEQILQTPKTELLAELQRSLDTQPDIGYLFDHGIGSFIHAVEKELLLYTQWPLLDNALRPVLTNRHFQKNYPCPAMVSLLLRYGADPNVFVPCRRETVWERYIDRMHIHKRGNALKNQKNDHIAIVLDLLRHKADP
ncbi:small s protein [Podospora didyma]|uniref:Small s protein n=1 Tax=Podospora didyma TaxID=330526 RepID=A0AAE0KA39_9PEZI|nr:small s protein [Podospora didyma]